MRTRSCFIETGGLAVCTLRSAFAVLRLPYEFQMGLIDVPFLTAPFRVLDISPESDQLEPSKHDDRFSKIDRPMKCSSRRESGNIGLLGWKQGQCSKEEPKLAERLPIRTI